MNSDSARTTRRMLKMAVLFVRRSSLVSRRSQAEIFIPCEIRFTRDASRDTVFALADFFSILLGLFLGLLNGRHKDIGRLRTGDRNRPVDDEIGHPANAESVTGRFFDLDLRSPFFTVEK